MAKWLYICPTKGVNSYFYGTFTGFPVYTGVNSTSGELIYRPTEKWPGSYIYLRYGSAQDPHWGPVSTDYWGEITVNGATFFEYYEDDRYPSSSNITKDMVLPNKLFRDTSDNGKLDVYSIVYSDEQIQGRCLIKNVGTPFPNGALIPVHFTMNGVEYEGIGNYSSFSTGYAFLKSTTNLAPKAIRRSGEKSNTLILDTINVDDILDFGNVPQNVPSIFEDWVKGNNIHIEVRDLKDTTWNIPSGWNAVYGHGAFDVSGSFVTPVGAVEGNDNIDDSGTFTSLNIGYSASDLYEEDYIYFAGYGKNITASTSFTVTFTGGKDTANIDLIVWLHENGSLRVDYLNVNDLSKESAVDIYTVPKGWTFERFIGSEFDVYNKLELVNNNGSMLVYYNDSVVVDNNKVIQYAESEASGSVYYTGDRTYVNVSQPYGVSIFCDGKLITSTLDLGETAILFTKGLSPKSDIVIRNNTYDSILHSPVIEQSGSYYLDINDPGGNAVSYDVYVNGVLGFTVFATDYVTEIYMPNVEYDFNTGDDYTIFVIAKSDGCADSDPSNSIVYHYMEYAGGGGGSN